MGRISVNGCVADENGQPLMQINDPEFFDGHPYLGDAPSSRGSTREVSRYGQQRHVVWKRDRFWTFEVGPACLSCLLGPGSKRGSVGSAKGHPGFVRANEPRMA